MHLPSAAQLYEQLAPLFVWDHAVAVSCWLLFYAIEAAAIIAILREHPDDNQAVRSWRAAILGNYHDSLRVAWEGPAFQLLLGCNFVAGAPDRLPPKSRLGAVYWAAGFW